MSRDSLSRSGPPLFHRLLWRALLGEVLAVYAAAAFIRWDLMPFSDVADWDYPHRAIVVLLIASGLSSTAMACRCWATASESRR